MSNQWLSLTAGANYLGVHHGTLRRKVQRPKDPIPSYRDKDGKITIWKADLDAFRANLPYPSLLKQFAA